MIEKLEDRIEERRVYDPVAQCYYKNCYETIVHEPDKEQIIAKINELVDEFNKLKGE